MVTGTTVKPPAHHLSPHLPGAFGEDAFGRGAEAAARFFGTPRYIAGQTLVVVAWIALNAAAFGFHWDPYPFILLNLAFSTQAAYAAPLILLAQARQADRDKVASDELEAHRETLIRRLERSEQHTRRSTERLAGILSATLETAQRNEALVERLASALLEPEAMADGRSERKAS
jgi:uncharacterized membrane protein